MKSTWQRSQVVGHLSCLRKSSFSPLLYLQPIYMNWAGHVGIEPQKDSDKNTVKVQNSHQFSPFT